MGEKTEMEKIQIIRRCIMDEHVSISSYFVFGFQVYRRSHGEKDFDIWVFSLFIYRNWSGGKDESIAIGRKKKRVDDAEIKI